MLLSITLTILIIVEKIKILRQPTETTHIKESDRLCLEVDAIGFPYPRHQWFKYSDISSDYEEIQGANLHMYKVDEARSVELMYNCLTKTSFGYG